MAEPPAQRVAAGPAVRALGWTAWRLVWPGLLILAACRPLAPPREIALVARGMTFVLAEAPDSTNPVIPLRAGERVRVVLTNDAPGLIHDFTIPEWDVKTDQIRAGQRADVTFTVPDRPGRVEYHCTPHAELMSGFVDVSR